MNNQKIKEIRMNNQKIATELVKIAKLLISENLPYSVVDSDGIVIDQSSTLERAKDIIWEIAVEHFNHYKGKLKSPLYVIHEAQPNEEIVDLDNVKILYKQDMKPMNKK